MPPAAPVVQNLQDLVAQYTQAQAPQQAELDSENTANDTSGTTQEAGIDAAKSAAFTGIANSANARGATFSGFTPNAQAGYVGGTYLPSLAKLQAAIAGTRNTILGNKAALSAGANTDALNTQKTEQGALDTYNQNQANLAAEEQRQQEAEAASEKLNEENNAAANSRAAQPTAAETTAAAASQAQQDANSYLYAKRGGDGYVSPNVYKAAEDSWTAGGGSAATFNSTFGNYKNPANKNYSS